MPPMLASWLSLLGGLMALRVYRKQCLGFRRYGLGLRYKDLYVVCVYVYTQVYIHGWLSKLWVFLGPIIVRHLILRVPKKGVIILTTTHIFVPKYEAQSCVLAKTRLSKTIQHVLQEFMTPWHLARTLDPVLVVVSFLLNPKLLTFWGSPTTLVQVLEGLLLVP